MELFISNLCLIGLWWIITRLFPRGSREKVFCILVTLELILFMGLRDFYTGGIDLIRYYRHYNYLSGASLSQIFTYTSLFDSAGYYVVSGLFAKAGLPYQGWLFIISAFCVGVQGWVIYKYSSNKLLSFFLFFGLGVFTFQFSGLRQALAMTMVLLAYDSFWRKKTCRMCFWLLSAVLFHSTAVVAIVPLVFSRIPITKLTLLFYTLVIVLAYVFRLQLGQFFTRLYRDEYIGAYQSTVQIGTTAIFLLLILALFLFLFYSEIRKSETYEKQFIYIIGFAVVIQLFSSYAFSFTRLNFYFMQLLTIIIPLVADKKPWTRRFGALGQLASPMLFILISVVCISRLLTFINTEHLDQLRFVWER